MVVGGWAGGRGGCRTYMPCSSSRLLSSWMARTWFMVDGEGCPRGWWWFCEAESSRGCRGRQFWRVRETRDSCQLSKDLAGGMCRCLDFPGA